MQLPQYCVGDWTAAHVHSGGRGHTYIQAGGFYLHLIILICNGEQHSLSAFVINVGQT